LTLLDGAGLVPPDGKLGPTGLDTFL
jgi:hypothetical protein